MIDNEMLKNQRPFPFKETIDYFKNLAFCAGILAFSFTTTFPYKDNELPAILMFTSAGLSIGATLLARVANYAYLQAFPAASKRSKFLVHGFSVIFLMSATALVDWKLRH